MTVGHPGGKVFVLSALLLVGHHAVGVAHTDVGGLISASFFQTTPNRSSVLEHRYRIVGKVRLFLFWIGSDDVGGARVTWRRESAESATIALLIGSDPERAPRGVNEWGYLREQVRGDSADVFGVRTMTDPDSVDEAEAKLAQGDPPLYGAMCSTIADESASASTSVRVPRDVTYHRFVRLLDAVSTSGRWKQRRVARPHGVAPGFLTALDLLIHRSAAAAREGNYSMSRTSRATYVYKGTLYDLNLRSVEPIRQARVGSKNFANLVRGEYTIRNRETGGTTEFAVTYGVNGALADVPVQASYQPKWWFKVELQLDDTVDVPEDPSGDDSLSKRIGEICSRALGS